MRQVYLDAAASTPADPKVVEAMLDVLQGPASNCGSAHWAGRRAADLVRRAREQVSDLVGRSPSSVIFTAGATEANNLVLRGLRPVRFGGAGGRHSIVSARTEHPSVLATLQDLAAGGATVRLVDVDRDGCVDLDQLRELVDDTTLLVSLMAANNETGVLVDLARAAEIAHEAGALFHSDASQLLAWGPLLADVDLVTVSAHKMHGPQGVGALVATRETRELLLPTATGGGQEGGLRSGTVNVAGVVGLGEAAAQAADAGPAAKAAVEQMRDSLHTGLTRKLRSAPTAEPYPRLNGHPQARLPGVVNLAFGDADAPIDAEAILAAAPAVAASTGSACSAGVPGPSPVLIAMGHSTERSESSIRFSLSRLTTPLEVDEAVDAIAAAVDHVNAATGATTGSPWGGPRVTRESRTGVAGVSDGTGVGGPAGLVPNRRTASNWRTRTMTKETTA